MPIRKLAMRWSSPQRLTARVATACLIAACAAPPAASAAVSVVPIDDTQLLSGETSLPECLDPDLVGIVTGTERTVGWIRFTGDTAHVRLTTVIDYRVTFADGSWVDGTATELFNLQSKGDVPLVSTTTGTEPRTLYGPDGTPLGTAFLHFHGHITAFNRNGDGEITPDEVVTNYDQLTWTCDGGPTHHDPLAKA